VDAFQLSLGSACESVLFSTTSAGEGGTRGEPRVRVRVDVIICGRGGTRSRGPRQILQIQFWSLPCLLSVAISGLSLFWVGRRKIFLLNDVFDRMLIRGWLL
jgi:hypothetical protein